MAEVVGKRGPVDRGRNAWVLNERLDRRREEEIPAVIGVEERMHAVRIACAKQKIVAAVPDDQCEEALDTVENPFSPAQICVEDERGVRGGCPGDFGEVFEPLAARVE